jgi:hypothetical protein
MSKEQIDQFKKQQIENYEKQQRGITTPNSKNDEQAFLTHMNSMRAKSKAPSVIDSRVSLVDALVQGTSDAKEEQMRNENLKLREQAQILRQSITTLIQDNGSGREKVKQLEETVHFLLQEQKAISVYMKSNQEK